MLVELITVVISQGLPICLPIYPVVYVKCVQCIPVHYISMKLKNVKIPN